MTDTNSLHWRLNEIVILVVVSIVLGIVWWGWSLFYGLTAPLTVVGLNYLFVGFWFTGGILLPFLIRKPGAAIFGELISALVESFITQWGITALLWGLVQGIGAELIFLIFRYKNYNLTVLILAGIVSGLFSYTLDFFYMHYSGLKGTVILIQVSSVIISGAALGGALSFFIGKAIWKTDALKSLTGRKKIEKSN
ncbi:MAG: ECF transporter S component [Spirochaetales bacterium]|nr:ECF transporter S component [Spirochaetales bacterium]